MQSNAAQTGVRDSGAAKGKVEVSELCETQGEDFGRGVGKGAAKGLGEQSMD